MWGFIMPERALKLLTASLSIHSCCWCDRIGGYHQMKKIPARSEQGFFSIHKATYAVKARMLPGIMIKTSPR